MRHGVCPCLLARYKAFLKQFHQIGHFNQFNAKFFFLSSCPIKGSLHKKQEKLAILVKPVINSNGEGVCAPKYLNSSNSYGK